MLPEDIKHMPSSARVDEVRRFIDGCLERLPAREELARMAGFSLAHFERLFKARTGQSLAAYILRRRLERAGRKLRMGAIDITEVALAAGFESQAAFGKAFKQHFGFSPGQFRRLPCRAATLLLTRG